jgi:hypothetical protein
LEERFRELDRNRRAFTRCTLDLEPTTTDLRAFAHHRHAEVTFRAGCLRVEPDSVVLEAENDVVVFLADRDPHVSWLGVLEGVHHSLASDVVHEQRDRGGELDVLDVAVEADRGITPYFVGKGLECFCETLRPQWRTMQISDERTDPVRRLLLRVTDLVELHSHVVRLTLLQQLAGNVDLNGESEQHLGEVVMEVPGDLESLVGPFLGHRV